MNTGFRNVLRNSYPPSLMYMLNSLFHVTFMMDKATLLIFGIGIIAISMCVSISAIGSIATVAYPYTPNGISGPNTNSHSYFPHPYPHYAPFYRGINPWPGLGTGASAGGWPALLEMAALTYVNRNQITIKKLINLINLINLRHKSQYCL